MRCAGRTIWVPTAVRFIEVPPEVHARLDHAKALPLYQMIAKNVGIRRARGQFVLATNIDILISSELAAFIARRELDPDRMYRVDRHDAMNEVPMDRPIEDQLEYCRTHLIRVNTREGTFSVQSDGRPALSAGDVAPVEAGLLFGGGWFAVESHVKGENFRWASETAEVLLPADRDAGAHPSLMIEMEPGPATGGLAAGTGGGGRRRAVGAAGDRPAQLDSPAAGQTAARKAGVPGEDRRGDGGIRSAPAVLPRLPHGLGAAAAQGHRGGKFAGDGAAHRNRPSVAGAWNALQHVLNKLAHGGPLVPLTVPVSPRLRSTLKAYLEWGGVVGLVVNAGARVARALRRKRLTLPGSEIFAPGSGLMAGDGWGKLDDFRGEGYRKAASGAEMVAAPGGGTAVLGLQVEPYKSMTVKRFELALLDEAGRELGTRTVDGLTYVTFPVQRVAGRSDVYRLRFSDTSLEGHGLKVFWCGWEGAAPSAAEPLGIAVGTRLGARPGARHDDLAGHGRADSARVAAARCSSI